MNNIVYKLVTNDNWKKYILSKTNTFYGFDNDLTCGFIHLCKTEQLETVKNKKFKTEKNMTLLTVDLDQVNNVVWENEYPHVYGYLLLDRDIVKTEEYN
jgi:uncharacterized protein (DUF952 family)